MNFYLLLVAILAFSTTIDAATFKCYSRADGVSGEGPQVDCEAETKKCIAYYDASGKNVGACDAEGCDSTQSWCKECTTDNCNTRASIQIGKCHVRDASTAASSEGTETPCSDDPTAKCVSYYESGENWAKCNPGGCTSTLLASNPSCKDCTTENCNKRALIIRKCHVRDAATVGPAEGTETDCSDDPTAKCVAYTSGGKNWAKCNPGGCTSTLLASNPDCKECTTDNCNKRALIATTPAPTAAPGAGATRASVGWLTGIIAASACVLVLMKPF